MKFNLPTSLSENERFERSRLLSEASTWIGTKYVDHAAVKKVGADCAGFIKGALVNVGYLEDYDVDFYSPQQWLHRHYEDKTYLSHVLKICTEVEEGIVLPGDLVLYRMALSFTHGALVVSWPSYVLHAVAVSGVCGAHGREEGFLRNRLRRFFRLKRWAA